jgi:hypothetical protein
MQRHSVALLHNATLALPKARRSNPLTLEMER